MQDCEISLLPVQKANKDMGSAQLVLKLCFEIKIKINKNRSGLENKGKVVKQLIWKCEMVQIQSFQASSRSRLFSNEARRMVLSKKGE